MNELFWLLGLYSECSENCVITLFSLIIFLVFIFDFGCYVSIFVYLVNFVFSNGTVC